MEFSSTAAAKSYGTYFDFDLDFPFKEELAALTDPADSVYCYVGESVGSASDDNGHEETSCYSDLKSCDAPFKAFCASLPYELKLSGVPEDARSRTETLVRVGIKLEARDHSILPWKFVKLSSHQMAVRATMSTCLVATTGAIKNEGLILRARVFPASKLPPMPVVACNACIDRELRKETRKRSRTITANVQNVFCLTEHELKDRIITFSGPETLTMVEDAFTIAFRVTCYCRHHEERVGFRIFLELFDSDGALVAADSTPPIMITDDHKRRLQTMSPSASFPSASAISIIPDLPSPPLTPITSSAIKPQNSTVHTMLPSNFPPGHPTASTILSSLRQSRIQHVIPSEGPMYGGVEITVLGNFLDASLPIYFGNMQATVLVSLNATTIVVRLPPSLTAGFVPVTIGIDSFTTDPTRINESPVFFNYKNDIDRAVMELALQLIGVKITGRVDDARDVAMRIIKENAELAASMSSSSPSQNTLEATLLRVLETKTTAIDNEDLALTNETGQSLLHLATMMGFERLVEALVNICDNRSQYDLNGWTAAEYAFLAGNLKMLDILDVHGVLPIEIPESPVERSAIVFKIAKERLHALEDGAQDGLCRLNRLQRWIEPVQFGHRVRQLGHNICNRVSTSKLYIYPSVSAVRSALLVRHRLRSSSTPVRSRRTASAVARFFGRHFAEYTNRDLMVAFFWVPILFALIYMWLNEDAMQWLSSSLPSFSFHFAGIQPLNFY